MEFIFSNGTTNDGSYIAVYVQDGCVYVEDYNCDEYIGSDNPENRKKGIEIAKKILKKWSEE